MNTFHTLLIVTKMCIVEKFAVNVSVDANGTGTNTPNYPFSPTDIAYLIFFMIMNYLNSAKGSDT